MKYAVIPGFTAPQPLSATLYQAQRGAKTLAVLLAAHAPDTRRVSFAYIQTRIDLTLTDAAIAAACVAAGIAVEDDL